MKHKTAWIAAMAAVALTAVAGCSNGGATAPTGSRSAGALSMTIHWPNRTRLIPVDSQSITVVVAAGAQILQSQTVPRPATGTNTTTVTFPSISPGSVTVTASSYPNADGSGVAQATGALSATIVANKTTTTPALTMSSTIQHINVTASINPLAVGKTSTLVATATDGENPPEVVLVSPATVKWTADSASAITLAPSGLTAIATANTAGSHAVTASESESGKSGSVVLTITATPPATASILICDVMNSQVIGLDAIPPAHPQVYSPTTTQGFSPQSAIFDLQGRIIIADYPYRVLRVDDLTGANLVEFHPPSAASTLAIDGAGRIYYRDDNFYINRIDDFTGANPVKFTDADFNAPSCIVPDVGSATSSGPIYVLDTVKNEVFRFRDMTGAGVVTLGSTGSGASQFDLQGFGANGGEHGMAMDSQHRLYVADFNNSRIVRFDDITGKNWTVFAVPAGNGSTKPVSVALDHASPQHILFTTANTVYRMDDMTGTNLVKYGTAGTGAGHFNSTVGLAVK
ncbi:MAG: hypothetical protein KGJ62_00190 [Armatimonadetes bacterium]|nr:hypothetical protein [Armatimonadota bacterium]MDE2206042.1 hypothetical protein [Armatimonadota bacterium]